MADLPGSVLTNIFRFQSLLELKHGSMLVCKDWNDAANDPVLWRRATALISPSASSCLDLEGWVNGLLRKGLTRFSFHKHCPRELVIRFCQIASSRIKYLSVNRLKCLSAADMMGVVSICADIEELDVSSCSAFASFADLLLSSNRKICDFLPKLRKLDIGHTTNYEKTAHYPLNILQGINSNCFEYLGISGINFNQLRIEEKLFGALCKFRCLKGLDISFTDLSEAFLAQLGREDFPCLDEINLTGSMNLNQHSLQAILLKHSSMKRFVIKQAEDLTYLDTLKVISKSSVNLSQLDLANSRSITHLGKEGPQRMLELLFKNGLFNLKELSLSNCQLGDDFVCLICKNINGNGIEVLQVASCGITDNSMEKIFKYLTNLRKLDISRNYRITDKGLLGSNQKESQINERSVANDEQEVEDATEVGCLSDLKHLDDLSMMFLNRITDEGLKPLFKLKNLKRLSVRGCRLLTTNGIKALSMNLNNLQSFDVGKISVDDAVVKFVVKNTKFLYDLNLSESDITDQTLGTLQRNCQSLRNLDISGCDRITEEMVRKFIRGLGRFLFEFDSSVNVVFELATN